MLSFFKNIIDFITSAVKLIINGITGLISAIGQVGTLTATGMDYISALPSVLTFFALSTITLSIIFLIIGRNHGE